MKKCLKSIESPVRAVPVNICPFRTLQKMARGYAYDKIAYVSVRNYVRIFRKIEYAYDTWKRDEWKHVKC